MNTDLPIPPAERVNPKTDPPRIRPERLAKVAMVGGRGLIALLFVVAGVVKVLGPQPFLDHMSQAGVPTFLLPAVIALELGAGLALMIGWRVRDAAGALGIFCLMTATIFHHQIEINAERTSFFKDLAIAGGLLAMAASASASLRKNKGEAV